MEQMELYPTVAFEKFKWLGMFLQSNAQQIINNAS